MVKTCRWTPVQAISHLQPLYDLKSKHYIVRGKVCPPSVVAQWLWRRTAGHEDTGSTPAAAAVFVTEAKTVVVKISAHVSDPLEVVETDPEPLSTARLKPKCVNT